MRLSVEEVIQQCIDHYAYKDAAFLSELFFSQAKSDESLYYLCSTYYRLGRVQAAYSLLRLHGVKSSKTRFLLARCCIDINKLSEAELILTDDDPILSTGNSNESMEERFGKSAPFARVMLASIYCKTNRLKQSANELKHALKLNPFLWSAFEQLCQNGNDADVASVRQIFTNFINAEDKNEPKTKQRRPLSDNSVEHNETPSVAPVVTSCVPVVEENFVTSTPSPLLDQQNPLPKETAPKAPKKHPGTSRRGLTSSQNEGSIQGLVANQRVTRRQSQLTVLSQNQPALGPNTRRSARLFQTSKENSTSSGRQSFGRKNRISQLNEINITNSERTSTPLIIEPDDVKDNIDEIETTKRKPCFDTETKRTIGTPSARLLSAVDKISVIALSISRYDSEKAIELWSDLPDKLKKSPPVMVYLARAHFEAANYKKAVNVFSECHRLYGHFTCGMEYYSTALWHLQMEMELSSLSQQLTDTAKGVPETWCVVGNCFSLQKEHDVAIRFFQRAIQLDENFTYAYTLLGHEYNAVEDFTKAAQAFRSALRINSKHFNAWYGLGLICYKQEHLKLANVHFQRALDANPRNSVLMCHLAIVQQALDNSDGALILLDRALDLTPQNALCHFHRAQLLFNKEKYQQSLEELKQLKILAPKEPAVFFLACKVHKKLGETHLALMNLSWATELDPRGEQQNPLVGDRRYDEEPVTALAAIDPDEVGGIQQMDSDDSV